MKITETTNGMTNLTVNDRERDVLMHALFFYSDNSADEGCIATRLGYVVENHIEDTKPSQVRAEDDAAFRKKADSVHATFNR